MNGKNILAMFLFAMVFAILASSVSAFDANIEIVPVTNFVSVNVVNKDATINFHRGEEFTIKLMIEANENLTNLRLEIPTAIRNEYNMRINNVATTSHLIAANLEENSSIEVEIKMTIPARKEHGEGLIGLNALKITADQGNDKTYNLRYNSPNMLEYINTEIRVNNRASFSASPLDEVEVIVTFRNLFVDHNIRMENVEVDLMIYNLEDMGTYDFEDRAEIRAIQRNQEGKASIRFSVPFDVLEGMYDIEVSARGRDLRGAVHDMEPTNVYSLELKRKLNDLYIRTASLSRTILSCENTRTTLDVNVFNIGSRRQEDVAITVSNEDFEIFQEERNIKLESIEYYERDARVLKSFHVNIPRDAEVGTHYLRVLVYRDGLLVESEDVRFEVRECPIQEEEERVTPPIVIEERPREPVEVITPEPVEEVQETDFMLFLLAGLNLVLIVALIALLMVVLKKPSRKDKYF